MGVFCRLQEHPFIEGGSKLVWFGVAATSIIGTIFLVKKLSKKKKPSPTHSPSLSPPLPPYTRYGAASLCPALVIMSLNPDGDMTHSRKSLRGPGFIVTSREATTVVWGSAWFLYDFEAYRLDGSKKVGPGKIVVTLEYPKLYGEFFEGTPVHIDYQLDIAVIVFKAVDCPTATLADLDSCVDFSEPHLGLDFYSYLELFMTEPYYFHDDVECESCGPCLHIELGVQSAEGVIIDSQKKIVGMKMSTCGIRSDRAHVLPVSFLFECLGPYTFSNLFNVTCFSFGEETMEIGYCSSIVP